MGREQVSHLWLFGCPSHSKSLVMSDYMMRICLTYKLRQYLVLLFLLKFMVLFADTVLSFYQDFESVCTSFSLKAGLSGVRKNYSKWKES